jgi:hypothetical protein
MTAKPPLRGWELAIDHRPSLHVDEHCWPEGAVSCLPFPGYIFPSARAPFCRAAWRPN